MKLDEPELGRLLRDPAVESVELDRPLKLVPRLAEMRAITKIESIWPVDRGNFGKGKLIAVIDSGLDSDIPELKGRIVAENCVSSEPDCYNPQSGRFDTSRASGKYTAWTCVEQPKKLHAKGEFCKLKSHGTRVAVVAAGSGAGPGDYAGFGPKLDVAFVHVKITTVTEGSFAKAFEVAMQGAGGRMPSVITVSIGLDDYRGDQLCAGLVPALEMVIKQARGFGITLVNSAGNEGSSFIDYPGCLRDVLSIGASTEETDKLAKFSDTNPLVDLLSPADSVLAFAFDRPLTAEGGTSFAAPSVAATIALLSSAFPFKTGDEIVTALKCSGKYLKSIDVLNSTPRIDAAAAYKFLSSTRTPDAAFEFNAANDLATWSVANGSWKVAGGKLVHDGQAQKFLTSSATTDLCFDDFYAELSGRKVRVLKNDAFGPKQLWTMMFLGTHPSALQSEVDFVAWDGYYIQAFHEFGAPLGVVSIRKLLLWSHDPSTRPAGNASELKCSSAVAFDPKAFNRIGALKKGKTLTAYLNGQKLCSITLDPDRWGVTGTIRSVGTFNSADLTSGNSKTETDEIEYLRVEQR